MEDEDLCALSDFAGDSNGEAVGVVAVSVNCQ